MLAGLLVAVLGARAARGRRDRASQASRSTPANDASQPSTPLGRESLKQRRALLLVFLVFAALAFSGDILDAATTPSRDEDPSHWHLVLVDAGLLLAVGLLGRRARPHDGARLPHEAGAHFFVAGAALMLLLDVLWVDAVDNANIERGWKIALSLVWIVPLALLACYVLAVDPLKLWVAFRRAERPPVADPNDPLHAELVRARDKVVSTLPLVIGVAATYIAQELYFEELPRIDREYFAQMSEVIPVLLVALAIDASFLSAEARVSTTRWAISVYAVTVLVAAEALAISALPVDNKSEGELLYHAHQYLAFSLTIYGCFVALAALVMMNATGLGRRVVPPS